ncbi:hypothetical protein BGY98DRAFT_113727 [Russula aff. rugulosa BPL654]|nr:hypothetical protein BGY98DRAFT_113727 [Russula aff. rugulosa BPL654]
MSVSLSLSDSCRKRLLRIMSGTLGLTLQWQTTPVLLLLVIEDHVVPSLSLPIPAPTRTVTVLTNRLRTVPTIIYSVRMTRPVHLHPLLYRESFPRPPLLISRTWSPDHDKSSISLSSPSRFSVQPGSLLSFRHKLTPSHRLDHESDFKTGFFWRPEHFIG